MNEIGRSSQRAVWIAEGSVEPGGSGVTETAWQLGRGSQRLIDCSRREHVLGHHRCRADDAGAVAQTRRHDSQVACGKWQGAAEDSFTHTCQQLLVSLGDVAAN